MPGETTITTRLICWIAATLILVSPALWNGFPFLQWGDTGGYLARWFEGTLSPNRSTTYGLFLAAGSPLDFWPVVIVQAAAVVWVIAVTLRIHRFNVHPAGLLAIVAILAVTTALPWLSSALLPDLFVGPAVLALHALVWSGSRIGSRESVGLVVFIAFAGSTHSATYAVLLVLCAAMLLIFLIDRELVPRAAIARVTGAMVLGAAILVAANYVVAKRIVWTPGGYAFAFASMLQNGIVTHYLDDHCPDQRLKLCPYRNDLPSSADTFLWSNSVFNRLGRFGGLGDEMRTIVLGSLREYPGMQIKAALIATARQLRAVRTGEGIIVTPYNYDIMERYTPSVIPAMRAARQQQGAIDFRVINVIHRPLAWAALAFLLPLSIFGLRSAAFADLGCLAATISIALLANAAVCGAISGPHDRYGSRIVWIAVFAAALAAWRGYVLAREHHVALNRKSASTV